MSLQPGTVFQDRYQVRQLIGRGGFGTVYLAYDPAIGRDVALKIVDRAATGDPAMRQRVGREITALQALNNPHTVQLFGHGETTSGELYLVFEYIAGEDLSALIARAGRLPPPAVRHIISQILVALDAAHRAGLVHRDLKPDNVRIFAQGADPHFVKLLDFGIVRPTDTGSPSVTKTGELIGTPRYMSPEQLRGQPLTPASDIYSLGLIAFELLAGSHALGGHKWGEQLERLLAGHVLEDAGAEQADPQLMAVVQRMTAVDPSARLQSARAVLDALNGPARPIAHGGQPPAATRDDAPRRGAGSWVLAAAVVLLIGLVALSVIIRNPQTSQTAVARESEPSRKPNTLIASERPPTAPSAPIESDALEADAGKDMSPPPIELGDWASEGCRVPMRAPDETFVPRSYSPSVPHGILVLLHSDGQLPDVLMGEMHVDELAEREHLVVLHPRGFDEGFAVWRKTVAGAQLVADAVAAVQERLCIDRRRTYVLAQADGGRVAERLACEPWVTATVVHGHALTGLLDRCDHPGPLLWMHAMDSIHLPLSGGAAACSGKTKVHPDDVDAAWRKTRGCRPPATTWYQGKGGACQAWECTKAPYVSCRLDGGREWPDTTYSLAMLDWFNPGKINGCGRDKSHQMPVLEQSWRFLSEAPLLEVQGAP